MKLFDYLKENRMPSLLEIVIALSIGGVVTYLVIFF